MLFRYIVTKTNKVAIGPLEYCGNGTIIWSTRGEKRCMSSVPSICILGANSQPSSVALVRGDPTLTEYQAKRQMKAIQHRAAGLDQQGKAKKAMTMAQRNQVERKFAEYPIRKRAFSPTSDDNSMLASSDPPEPLDAQPPAAKRRRLSHDKHLALLGKENLETEPDLERRRRRRSTCPN